MYCFNIDKTVKHWGRGSSGKVWTRSSAIWECVEQLQLLCCVILQATRFLIYLLFAFSPAFYLQWCSGYAAAGAERMWVFDSVKASQRPVAARDQTLCSAGPAVLDGT